MARSGAAALLASPSALLLSLLLLLVLALRTDCLIAEASTGRRFKLCKLETVYCSLWSNAALRKATVTCRTEENMGEFLLCQEAFAEVLTQLMSLNLTSFQKVTLTFENVQLVLTPSPVKVRVTELRLNFVNLKVNSIQKKMFDGKYFPQTDRKSLLFENCTLDKDAIGFLTQSLNGTTFDSLHFNNVSWDRAPVFENIQAENFRITQPAAAAEAAVLRNVTVNSNVEISGRMTVHLQSVTAGTLELTGVRLGNATNSRNVATHRLSFTDCSLPEGADKVLGGMTKSGNTVAFAGTDLENLPRFPAGNSGVAFLSVTNCRLRRCDFDNVKSLKNLLALKVTNTSLQSLPASYADVVSGRILFNLHTLDLSFNRLRTVPQVPDFKQRTPSGDKEFEVSLQGNPLHCNCSLKWLGGSAQKVNLVFRNVEPTCLSPPELRGRRVTFVEEKEFCQREQQPVPSVSNSQKLLWLLVVAAAVVLLGIIGAVVWTKCCCSEGRRGEVRYTLSPWEENPLMHGSSIMSLATSTKVDGLNGSKSVPGDGKGCKPTGV